MDFNTTSIDLIETGKRILIARVKAGLSVRDLQAALGLTAPNTIYKWQRGECLPKLDHLVIISVLLEVPMDELIVYRKTQVSSIYD